MYFTNVRFLLFFAAWYLCNPLNSQDKPAVSVPRWGMKGYTSIHTAVERDTLQTKAWIDGVIQEFNGKQEFCEGCQLIEPAVNDATGFERISYRLQDNVILAFPDGSKVRIRCHSAHVKGEIGDVVVAQDSKGRVYVNFSHICGGLIRFYDAAVIKDGEGKLVLPLGSGIFFRKFQCDTDDKGWELWEGN